MGSIFLALSTFQESGSGGSRTRKSGTADDGAAPMQREEGYVCRLALQS